MMSSDIAFTGMDRNNLNENASKRDHIPLASQPIYGDRSAETGANFAQSFRSPEADIQIREGYLEGDGLEGIGTELDARRPLF